MDVQAAAFATARRLAGRSLSRGSTRETAGSRGSKREDAGSRRDEGSRGRDGDDDGVVDGRMAVGLGGGSEAPLELAELAKVVALNAYGDVRQDAAAAACRYVGCLALAHARDWWGVQTAGAGTGKWSRTYPMRA